jgi:RNA polymerase sigma-70 factor, ECF subfamily
MPKPSAQEAEPSDRELLARHSSGDRDAFGELVRRHRDRLWRVALRTLGDPDDAADAVQDALVSAFRAASGYRGEAAVTTWLHRIVVNACLDLARRRTSRPTTPLADSPALAMPAADTLGDRETSAEILAALRELPTEQAAAIVLVDVEGYPVAEVAEILEVPAGTVKSRCARGRARLAVRLDHLAPRNPDPEVLVQPNAPKDEEGR